MACMPRLWDWHIEPTPAQVDSALARYLRDTRFDVSVTQMRPEYEEYKALQKQLVRYREIIARGAWEPVPEGKAIKPGQSAPLERLTALRERLRAEGYAGGSAAASATPEETTAASESAKGTKDTKGTRAPESGTAT